MVKPDMAIASFVLKENIAIIMGIMRPPPPTPPTFASAIKNVSVRTPKNSER